MRQRSETKGSLRKTYDNIDVYKKTVSNKKQGQLYFDPPYTLAGIGTILDSSARSDAPVGNVRTVSFGNALQIP